MMMMMMMMMMMDDDIELPQISGGHTCYLLEYAAPLASVRLLPCGPEHYSTQ